MYQNVHLIFSTKHRHHTHDQGRTPWDKKGRKQTLRHSFNLILNKVAFHKCESPVLVYWKPRFAVNYTNWNKYPADQGDPWRIPIQILSEDRDAWLKTKRMRQKEEEHVLLSLALKHDSPHWYQCWESTDQSENATKSAAIGGSSKAQGRARRQRINPSCSPLSSQQVWQPTHRSQCHWDHHAASPAVPLPHRKEPSTGNGVKYDEPRMVHPGIIRERINSVKQPGICFCAYRRNKNYAQLLGQTVLDSQVYSIFSISQLSQQKTVK